MTGGFTAHFGLTEAIETFDFEFHMHVIATFPSHPNFLFLCTPYSVE